jgi:PBP1b-binding outer membrane lipoprotein LpoB
MLDFSGLPEVPMKTAVRLAAVALGALLLGGCSSGDALEYVSWARARERSREEKKPILINFGGPW